MDGGGVYQASPIKRNRATKAEMAERAAFLIDYAERHGPVTVRQEFYAATVAGLIEKSESGYSKVQAQVLKLRREGKMPYRVIADATRYMRKPRTFDGIEDALQSTARLYRKALWSEEVEIWVEKSGQVTAEYEADRRLNIWVELVVYALYEPIGAGR